MWAILLLFLLQSTPTANSPVEAERLFALGVQLYADGDTAGAVAAFEGAESSGWTSGMLQYNLGTAYLNLEQHGPAILHFERARRLMPGNEGITHNLRIARQRAGHVQDAASPLGLVNSRLSLMGGPPFWLALGFVLYLSLIGLVGRRFWTRKNEPWSRRAVTALVPVTLCVLVIAFSAWGSTRVPEGIVLSEDAELRTTPSLEATSRATLQPGQRVRMTGELGGWQAVRLAGGVRGWLPSRTVERI